MNFLFPTFLYGLLALSIPIIIHLFNFRSYKVVYFSNVSFLKNIKKESKAKSQLRHFFVLLMRLLALTALVFAFARPYIPITEQDTAAINRVGIYIDNSFSTEADSKYGKLSELAKKKARQIVDAYPADTKFIFLNNNFSPRHQHFVSKEQLKEFIDENKISPAVKKISEVLTRANSFFSAADSGDYKNTVYVISDFQKTTSDFKNTDKSFDTKVVLIPLQAESQNNLYIDSVWFENPSRMINQADELFVKITNKSDEEFHNIPLKLFINDTLKTLGSFNIKANSSTTQKLAFTNINTGIIRGKVEITDYPIIFDNDFYFSYNIDNEKKILTVGKPENEQYIDAVFENNDFFKLTYFSENNIKTSEIADFDILILNGLSSVSSGLIQETVNFVADGGNLIVFANADGNIESYNKLFNKLNVNYITSVDTTKTYIGSINYQSSIFRNVFKKQEKNPNLPFITKRVKFSNLTQSNEEVILSTENNNKVLSKSAYGQGLVYVFSNTANRKSGNFVFHSLWAPLMYNIVMSGNESKNIFYIIGKDRIVKLPRITKQADEVIHISDISGVYDFIPRSGGNTFMTDNIKQAGAYTVKVKSKDIKGLAFNYNRVESDIEQFKPDSLTEIIEKNELKDFSVLEEATNLLTKSIQEKSSGIQLWRYFIMAALLFLLLEIVGVRLLK